jgi:hypothetical protein
MVIVVCGYDGVVGFVRFSLIRIFCLFVFLRKNTEVKHDTHGRISS